MSVCVHVCAHADTMRTLQEAYMVLFIGDGYHFHIVGNGAGRLLHFAM